MKPPCGEDLEGRDGDFGVIFESAKCRCCGRDDTGFGTPALEEVDAQRERKFFP